MSVDVTSPLTEKIEDSTEVEKSSVKEGQFDTKTEEILGKDVVATGLTDEDAEEIARKDAVAAGLQLGENAKHPFASGYATKGLYTFSVGKCKDMAFYGRGGTAVQRAGPCSKKFPLQQRLGEYLAAKKAEEMTPAEKEAEIKAYLSSRPNENLCTTIVVNDKKKDGFFKIKKIHDTGAATVELVPPDDGWLHSFGGMLRGLLKATLKTQNMLTAKDKLAKIMQHQFDAMESDTELYNNCAALMASARSGNVDLSKMNPIHEEDFFAIVDLMCVLLRMNKNMVLDGATNIYHVAAALDGTPGASGDVSFWSASLCAAIQFTLFVYIGLDVWQNIEADVNLATLPLAFLLLLFYLLYVKNGLETWKATYDSMFWHRSSALFSFLFVQKGIVKVRRCTCTKLTFLWFCDLICNCITPILLLPAGFLLIIKSEAYMDAVLNSSALLFVPMLDDEIPSLLGLRPTAIIQDYIVAVGGDLLDYIEEEHLSGWKTNVKPKKLRLFDRNLTGYNSFDGFEVFESCHLFAIATRGNGKWNLRRSQYISPNCLFKKIEYTIGDLSKNDIGWMRLTQLDGKVFDTTSFRMGGAKKRYDVSNAHASTHREITGCFIITEFDSSEAIQHLRIFGAPTAAELSNGLEAFGMFDIDDAAAKMLSKQHATEEDSSSPKSGIEGV